MKSELSSIQKPDKIQEQPKNILFTKEWIKAAIYKEAWWVCKRKSLGLLPGMVLLVQTHTHTNTYHNEGKQKGMTSFFTRHINTFSGKIKLFSSMTVKKHTLCKCPRGPVTRGTGKHMPWYEWLCVCLCNRQQMWHANRLEVQLPLNACFLVTDRKGGLEKWRFDEWGILLNCTKLFSADFHK